MSAESIARVISHIKAGTVTYMDDEAGAGMVNTARMLFDKPTIVDATKIYDSLVERDEPVALYEDHPCITPPWPEAAICYVNQHGNVIVMHTTTLDRRRWLDDEDAASVPGFTEFMSQTWETDNDVDWDRVRWQSYTFVWTGGWSPKQQCEMKPIGPLHLWTHALYEDGEPADLHWVQIVDDDVYPMKNWDMAQLTLLGALNFINCRNVELVDPVRPRGERRRLERIGERVQTLSVFPAGRSTRSNGAGGGGVPLTSVRGHFAKYGPQYERGLLFGKYAGRFFIPQHARGERSKGVRHNDYRLEPE